MRQLAALCLAVLLATAVNAQPRVPLDIEYTVPGTTSYDTSIPTTAQELGFTLGQRHIRPEEVIRYVEAIAETSQRVTSGFHGSTYEGRRLVHAIVTSPANHARLDAIQAANRRLADEPGALSDDELASMPTILFMAYSVHGNEASGTDASMAFLYHLAAGQGDVERQLEDVVIVMVPMLNPDGRDRFADWVAGNHGGVATGDPQNREHREPWPGGRTNHYWFDLNRDWFPQQLRESQGRMALWHQWRPQVTTDHHEMGSEATYFFQPGIPSRNNPNSPARTFELTGDFAGFHASELDRIGSLYYSQESFDDFYYGKGSTYPDPQGGIGILFEQASSRAVERDTETNGRLTYAFTVRNQLATSISTLQAAVAHREDLLRHARDTYAGASDVAQEADTKAYIIGLGDRRTRGLALAETLQRSRIKLYTLSRSVEVNGKTYEPRQAVIVPVDQPQARLVRGAMERTLTYTDSLFYDVSAWTFPLAFGADVAELTRLDASLLGTEAGPVDYDGGRLDGGRADYAYLVRWDRYFAPRTLRRLQQANVRVRLARAPFSATVAGAQTDFPRGTLIVPVRQPDAHVDSVHAIIQRSVQHDDVLVSATSTGFTANGPDFGSGSSPVLPIQRIAILSGDGTSSYAVGEVWHLLTERFGQPVTLLDVDLVARADLSRYTTIVMPNGFYSALADSTAKAKLTSWVRSGGVLVGTQSGATWLARNGLVRADTRAAERDTTTYPYDQRDEARGAQAIGGSIFEVRLDTTHPLAFGYGESVSVFKNGTTMFKPDTTGGGTDVGVYSDDPVQSGYISAANLERLPGAAALKAYRVGGGRVVLMDFNPTFRAFWWGTDGLLLNAIYLGSTF
ncbi:MAG: M14 family metallopeptidase [Rubricoccaceae bacterium]